MKKRSQLEFKQYYGLKLSVSFSFTPLSNGHILVYTKTNVKGYHTPYIECSMGEFRAYRQEMHLVGFRQSDHTTEMYYQPKKIA